MYELKPFETVLSVDAAITAFDAVHPAGFYFTGEMHDFWEAVCVVEGQANAAADGRIYALSSGDILFHKPMEFHRIWADEGEHRVVIISFAAHGEAMQAFENRQFKLTQKQINEFIETERKVSEVISGTDGIKSNVAKNALENFLLSLCVRDAAEALVPDGEFGRIVKVMRDNVAYNITLSELAKKLNMSESTLKKKFARYCDIGIMKYFNKLKIRRAIELLQDGESIKEVAFALGFSSINYFHTVFKRETGVTPISYLIGRGETK